MSVCSCLFKFTLFNRFESELRRSLLSVKSVWADIWFVVYLLQAKKSQTVETNLKNITLAKFDLDFEVSLL